MESKQVLNNADIIMPRLNILQRTTNTSAYTLTSFQTYAFTWKPLRMICSRGSKRVKGLIEEAKKDSTSFYHRFTQMSLADVGNGIHTTPGTISIVKISMKT